MQVILTKSVRKLGKVGEIVNVANGYGRNYLVPQELAVRATKENITQFDTIKGDLEKKNNEAVKLAEKAAKAMEGKHIVFITQSAADGRLFGSVSAKALAIEISKLTETNLSYNNIIIESPIKYNGVYEISVSLHADIVENILVVVAKTESEAQESLKEYKEGGVKDSEEEKQKELEMQAIEAAAEQERAQAKEESTESAE